MRNVKDVQAEVVKQITTSFKSSSGPLWRAVVFVSHTAPYLSEVSKKYPRQYDLLMTYHHAITDGFTTLRVANLFLGLLNDIIAGKDIDPREQLGEFNDGAETETLIAERQKKFDTDIKWKKSLEMQIEKYTQFRPIFTKYFPVLESQKENTTKHIYHIFDESQTKKLLNFFKYENVTVTSGFVSLANLQLVEMFKKRGCEEQMYEIPSYITVNLRRYWEKQPETALGCHFGPLCLFTETPHDSIKNFLDYARDINTNLQDYIVHKRTLDDCQFLNILQGTNYESMDDFFENPPDHPQFFHSTTNMGDVSSVLKGEGKHAQITWLSRHNSLHRYNSTLINELQTFRGRLLVGVGYNARTITKAVAEEYLNGICRLMIDIIKNSVQDAE